MVLTKRDFKNFHRLIFLILSIAQVQAAGKNSTDYKKQYSGYEVGIPSLNNYVKRETTVDAGASTLEKTFNVGKTKGGSNYEDGYGSSGSGEYRSHDYLKSKGQFSQSPYYDVPTGGYRSPMQSQASSHKYHIKFVPQKGNNFQNGWGQDSYEDYDDDKDGKDLKGLLGLLGLTGLVGLKPLKLLGLLTLPFAPILIPLALLLGALLFLAPLLLLLFIPIPIPIPGRTANPSNPILIGRSEPNVTALNEIAMRALDSSNGSMKNIFKRISNRSASSQHLRPALANT